jgi:hypothetical protein
MEKLKDIKPIINITNYDFFYYIGFSLLSIIMIVIIIFLIRNKLKPETYKVISKEEQLYKELIDIDFKKQKEAIYLFSINAKFFKTEKNEKEYIEIINFLEKYKYQKNTPDIKKEERDKIKKYIKEIKCC